LGNGNGAGSGAALVSTGSREGQRKVLEEVYKEYVSGGDAIDRLFGGKYHTFGSAETVRVAIRYLQGLPDAHRRFLIDVCISFMEKPKSIIIAGFTAAGGDGKGWGVKPLQMLPSYASTMSPEDAEIAEKTKLKNLDSFMRSKGIRNDAKYTANAEHNKEVEAAFCKINVTAVKNIALLAIMSKEQTPTGSTTKWLKKYNDGNNLDKFETNPRRPTETEKIRAEMVGKFLDAYKMLGEGDLKSSE
jgi:hypothetical protein